jgi:lipid-A-disaccharide synthase-like uncharacterized protein
VRLVDFEWWHLFGWASQALFTWRVLHQWWSSERAGRSFVDRSFWVWSVAGSALQLVYGAFRRDPIWVVGPLVSGSIYVRNLWMSRPHAPPRTGRPSLAVPVLCGLALFALVVVESMGPEKGLVKFEAGRSVPWLVVAFVGQSLWVGRFVLQWWVSEREGRSHLPASFFVMSLVGAVLLFAYACSQSDLVNIAAYALNPIPYVRNLVLLRRHARASERPPESNRGADAELRAR